MTAKPDPFVSAMLAEEARRIDAVPVEARAALTAAGFSVWQTGGGCLAWSRDLGDGTHLLVTGEDEDLNGPPEAPVRNTGRHGDDGFVYPVEGTPLAECLEAAAALPRPEDRENVHADLREAFAARSAPTP